jgi:hypothetical protein
MGFIVVIMIDHDVHDHDRYDDFEWDYFFFAFKVILHWDLPNQNMI